MGEDGPPGDDGVPGAAGAAGAKGATGVAGALGPPGDDGAGGDDPPLGFSSVPYSQTFYKGAAWISNSSSQMSNDTNTVDVLFPFACTLKEVSIQTAGGPGSCAVDVWSSTVANYPPTAAGDITGGTPPAISSGSSYDNGALSGWTTAIAAGTIIRFTLASVSTFTFLAIKLRCQPT